MLSRILLLLGIVVLSLSKEPYYYKYATYKAGRQYDNGDRIRVNTEVYQCRPPPHNKNCVKDVFAPTGKQRDKAWFKVEADRIAEEGKDFHLPEYTRHYEYKLNELVQFRGRAYRCITALFCGLPDTLPGTELADKVWLDISTTYKVDAACRGNSATDNVSGSGADTWAQTGTYSYGDRVILSGQLFECESVPNGQFCSSSAFKPGTKKGKVAWKNITCKDLSREKASGKGTAYTPGKAYKIGDIVHWRGVNYQCVKEDYCSLKSYHPAVGLPGAWVKIYNASCPKASAHSLLQGSLFASHML